MSLLCEYLSTIEDISGRGRASTVIFKKLTAVQCKYDPVYAAFLKRYERAIQNGKGSGANECSGERIKEIPTPRLPI